MAVSAADGFPARTSSSIHCCRWMLKVAMPSPPHPRSRSSVCSKDLHVLAASSRVDTANTDVVISATVSVPGQSPPNWVDARAKSLHVLRLHQLVRHSALAVVEVPVESRRHGSSGTQPSGCAVASTRAPRPCNH